jgi:hypothetical protein
MEQHYYQSSYKILCEINFLVDIDFRCDYNIFKGVK